MEPNEPNEPEPAQDALPRWCWMSRITEMTLDTSARGVLSLPPETFFFRDHFPGFPVVPGVILLEGMAQLSGKLIGWSVRRRRGDWPFPILSMANNVKFRRFVRPDEEAVLESRIVQLRDESAICEVRTWVGGKLCAQAEEIFVFNAVKLADPAESDRLEAIEQTELQRLWEGYDQDEQARRGGKA